MQITGIQANIEIILRANLKCQAAGERGAELFSCGGRRAVAEAQSSGSGVERNIFFFAWSFFSRRTFSLARRERRRFWRRIFSRCCCSSLALPVIMFSIFSASLRLARNRFMACVRSRWTLTSMPVGRCFKYTQVATARADEFLDKVLLAYAEPLHLVLQRLLLLVADTEIKHLRHLCGQRPGASRPNREMLRISSLAKVDSSHPL